MFVVPFFSRLPGTLRFWRYNTFDHYGFAAVVCMGIKFRHRFRGQSSFFPCLDHRPVPGGTSEDTWSSNRNEKLRGSLPRDFLHADELHDAAGGVPVLDVEIAVGVPGGAVGAGEDAFDPLVLRDVEIAALLGVRVVAEHCDDRVGLVENYKPAVQIGDGNIVPLDGG